MEPQIDADERGLGLSVKRKPKHFEVLPIGEMRKKYYKPEETPPEILLDPSKVPEALRSLIPLAERWGISDDILRINAVHKASPDLIDQLKRMVALNDDLLDAWLAGPESESVSPSAEYVAFTCMRMAADGC